MPGERTQARVPTGHARLKLLELADLSDRRRGINTEYAERIVELHEGFGISQSEIARWVHTSPSAVRQLIKRRRQA